MKKEKKEIEKRKLKKMPVDKEYFCRTIAGLCDAINQFEKGAEVNGKKITLSDMQGLIHSIIFNSKRKLDLFRDPEEWVEGPKQNSLGSKSV